MVFPSNESVSRCRPLLRWVPRVGSPASSLVWQHSDSSPPCVTRLRRSARQFRLPGEYEVSQGSCASLVYVPSPKTPVVPETQDPGLADLRFEFLTVAFRVSHHVGTTTHRFRG